MWCAIGRDVGAGEGAVPRGGRELVGREDALGDQFVGRPHLDHLALLEDDMLLSYTGVSPRAAARSLRAEQADAAGATRGARHPLWAFLDRYTQRRHAAIAIAGAVAVAGSAPSRRKRSRSWAAPISPCRPVAAMA